MSDTGAHTPKAEEATEQPEPSTHNPDTDPMSPPGGPPPATTATEEHGTTSKEESAPTPPTTVAPSAAVVAPEQGASKGVRFHEEVSVAALQFDEDDEAVQYRKAQDHSVAAALEDPKAQAFYFREMGRNAPKKAAAPAPKKKNKRTVGDEGSAEEKDKETEAEKESEAEKKDGEDGVASGDKAAAAAMSGETPDESAPTAGGADSNSKTRPLKEKLRDFQYETDPNERLYWQGLVKIDDKHTTILEKEKELDRLAEEQRRAYVHKPSAASKLLPPNPTWDDFLETRGARTKNKAKTWAKKKAKTLADRHEDDTFTPEVGKKSKTLVKKMAQEQRYKDPVKGWDEHFNDFVSKEARYAARFEEHNVTPVRIRTTQDTFEKLHQESAIRQAAQDIVSQAQVAEYSSGYFKPETHRSYSSLGGMNPFDETSSYSSRSPAELVDSLLEKGEHSKKKIEELRRKSEEETYTFTPKTNKLSQKMVQSWSERAVTPRGERGGQSNKQEAARSIHDLSPDIKGVVDEKREKPRTKFDVDLFYSKMHRAASEREAKLKEIEERKKVDELAECTFRPRTRAYDGSQANQQSGSFYGSSYSTPRKGASSTRGNPAPARSNQPQQHTTPRTQRAAIPERQQPQPVSARSAVSRGSHRSQGAQSRDYVVDLVAVPPSSSTPTTARTLLDEEGSTDLAALQQELMGVIAEWQNIDA